jgi:hypothetical protein
MPWYTVRCTYADWERSYKRQTQTAHSHQLEQSFVTDAKGEAVTEMRGSGQPRFAAIATNQVGTSGLRVNLPNDPGVNYRQI